MKNCLKMVLFSSVLFVVGCNSISNPCSRLSDAELSEIFYSPTMHGEYLELDHEKKSELVQILRTRPKRIRGKGDSLPMGYLRIHGNLFEISASINYFSGNSGLQWSDKRIGRIALKLPKEYRDRLEDYPEIKGE